MMDDKTIGTVRDTWSALRPDIESMFTGIWEHPELPMMEYEAEAALSAWLADHDFRVERGVCGIPTAFRATWERGERPTIGFLAEYDALPGQGNLAEPRRAPDGHRAGHACGHNLIGGANAGAAIGVRHAMEALGLEGKVVVLGTPAEELLWGKIAMFQRGAFDGIDALLTSHTDHQNGAISRPCLSCVSAEFVFSGVSGHGGSRRSQNALDAAELTVQSMERLRAHQFSDAVVGHVLRVAGLMPSITCDEARLWITVRHESFERAEEVYNQILPVAADAARYTSTGFSEQFISASRGYLGNDTLGRVLQGHLDAIGPPAWDAEDLDFLAKLSKVCSPQMDVILDRGSKLHTKGCDPYGQDDGEASWYIPLARANWAQPLGALIHNWATTAMSGHTSGIKGGLMASEGLALAAVDLFRNPPAIAEAKDELKMRVNGRSLSPPRCGGFELMTTAPETFWDGTWLSGDRLAS